jgi:outer membrane receptor protein involved in Fe transport
MGMRDFLAVHALRRSALTMALTLCSAVHAQEAKRKFDIPSKPAATALNEFAEQANITLVFSSERVARLKTAALSGNYSTSEALTLLLADTGLTFQRVGEKTIAIREAAEQPTAAAVPKTAAQKAAVAASASELETITVVAQKKEENIQKVPIAITAFSGEELANRHIETGGDLVTATPNVTFSKTNFASYNFQIRGIGTQALSVTTDPAVAISFNSSPMIRNRLFEQEYFDVGNVEVLRGPQGTLYGRNATAGVVNMIPNLPSFDGYESWLKAETGNYSSKRVSGMANLPLSDTLALRLAGAWTDRSGYDDNTVTDNDVDGRNLFSTRASLAWKPSDAFNANLIWEHFHEHDNRARTGKQLCHTDPGPDSVDGVAPNSVDRNYLSQGCADGSLYGAGAYGVPNGASLPYVLAAEAFPGLLGYTLPDYTGVALVAPGTNPYAGDVQSNNLRQIATTYDPRFKAKNDVVQFNFNAEVGKSLKLVSQTLYTRDRYYSTQDYSRFQSNPIFTNTNPDQGIYNNLPDGTQVSVPNILPNGVFCDPQLGCSNRMLMVDLVNSYSYQWSQEFRLQSDYDGPFNFSVGANYLYYKVDESYYVFNNVFTAIAQSFYNRPDSKGLPPVDCPISGQVNIPADGGNVPCVYIDPNPLNRINGQGHNYFRSWNLANTRSAALFGETYWKLADDWKLTAGLRFTDDRKTTTPVPSQTLLAGTLLPAYPFGGGYVGAGYPAEPNIHQKWTKPTGRLVLDWTPHTSFTDSTLIYASYSRGYVAGGTNSPGIGANPDFLTFAPLNPQFKAEYVNAFELGTKNVLAGGTFTLNADVFYYDYKNYQVSQIVNRQSYNENFDAKTWGFELEAAWKPMREFQLSGNLGLLGTRIGPNQYSIDVMDPTAGNPNWTIVRPWMQLTANCIAPKNLVSTILQNAYAQGYTYAGQILNSLCALNIPIANAPFMPGGAYTSLLPVDANGNPQYYDPSSAPGNGMGIAKNVGGNSLPNAPHLTVSVSPQYTFFFDRSSLTVRADLYYQGKSWARIYQDSIDRLHDWGNVNLSATWSRPDDDWTVQLYVKNALNGKAITGTFLNSQDTGLTTNVFIQDPRIIGLSVRKGFY